MVASWLAGIAVALRTHGLVAAVVFTPFAVEAGVLALELARGFDIAWPPTARTS